MSFEKDKIPLLIITYLFPPRGGVGVQRIVKFIKYLPEYGFRPIVLTVRKPPGATAEDPEMEKEIPADVKVFRTFSFEPYHIYRSLGGRKRQDDPSFRSELVANGGKRGLLSRLYFEYQRRYLIPDPKIGWLKYAVREAEKIFSEYSPRIMLSTSPEATAHLIALKLNEKYKIPFAADFRDPWTQGHYSLERPAKARKKELEMEERVLEKSSAITCVMKSYIDGFTKEHPAIPQARFHIIPNGFDEADYSGIKAREFGHFTIAHTGSIYHQRSPIPMFKAINQLLNERPQAKDDFRLFLLGQVDTEYFKSAVAMGISDIIIHEGFGTHSESLSVQLGADVLLILSEGVMTAKVYEYLRAGKPIIGFAPSGELASRISEWGVGKVFSPLEYKEASGYLVQMYDSWKKGTLGGFADYKKINMAQYERRHQAAKLAEIMHALIK